MAFDFNAVHEDGPQPVALAVLTVLSALRADWGGQLILCCGLGPLGIAVAQAANVAGAACLSIEPEPAVCRAAMRSGACDFLVNTVDEALRVLKNEIRKRHPLSVALELGFSSALDELMERGVLPQLLTGDLVASDVLAAAHSFTAEGTQCVNFQDSLCEGSLDGAGKWERILCAENLKLRTIYAADQVDLKRFDAAVLATLPPSDLRRSWIESATRLFPRDRPYRRALLLTPQESEVIRR